MSQKKELFQLNQNIHFQTNNVSIIIRPGFNDFFVQMEIIVNSCGPDTYTQTTPGAGLCAIWADDKLSSPDVKVYKGSMQIVNKKIPDRPDGVSQSLWQIGFSIDGKVPGSPASMVFDNTSSILAENEFLEDKVAKENVEVSESVRKSIEDDDARINEF